MEASSSSCDIPMPQINHTTDLTLPTTQDLMQFTLRTNQLLSRKTKKSSQRQKIVIGFTALGVEKRVTLVPIQTQAHFVQRAWARAYVSPLGLKSRILNLRILALKMDQHFQIESLIWCVVVIPQGEQSALSNFLKLLSERYG
jgi:hypothetical protein